MARRHDDHDDHDATWVPSRVLLHAARTTSAALLSFAISFVLQALCLGATLPAILAHGTTAGTDSSWWATLLLAMSRISFVSALTAVLAVSVGTIGRDTSAALVAMAGWALLVERLVAGFWPKVARFMIAENVAIVASATVLFARRELPSLEQPGCRPFWRPRDGRRQPSPGEQGSGPPRVRVTTGHSLVVTRVGARYVCQTTATTPREDGNSEPSTN